MAAGKDLSYPLETSAGILLNVPISRAQGHQPDPRRLRAEPRSRTCLFCDCYFFLWGVGGGEFSFQGTVPGGCPFLGLEPPCSFSLQKGVCLFWGPAPSPTPVPKWLLLGRGSPPVSRLLGLRASPGMCAWRPTGCPASMRTARLWVASGWAAPQGRVLARSCRAGSRPHIWRPVYPLDV